MVGLVDLLGSGASRTQLAFEIVNKCRIPRRSRDLHLPAIPREGPDPGGLAVFTALPGALAPQINRSSPTWSAPPNFVRAGSTDARFLTAAYDTILGRIPDPAGTAYFLELLGSGQTRTQVAYDLLTSTEYRLIIASDYQHLLARQPSPADLVTQLGFLASGGTVEQLISNIVGSAEFYASTS